MAAPWLVVYRGALLVAILLGVFLTAKAIEHRDKRGGTPLLVLAVGALLYVGVKLAVSTVRGTPTVFVFTRGTVLGAGLATLGFFLFVVEYTGLETPVSNRTVGVLVIEPLLANSLVWIDITFFWIPVGRDATTVSGYAWELTSIAIANQLYMTLLLLVGLLLLLRFGIQSADAFTAQVLALIVAGSAQLAGNTVFYLGYVPFNPTPILFVLSGLLIAWAIIDKELLNLVPLGRDAIIDGLDAGVVTFDSSHRVIDINPAARRLFGFKADEPVVGEPLDEVFDGHPQFRALEWSETDREATQVSELAVDDRHFEVQMTTLTRDDDTVLGRTIFVRDVTDRVRRQQALERAFELNRAIQQIAVESRTRTDVELAFCQRLVEEPGRLFAWVGEPDETETLVPRAVAGRDKGYVQTVDFDLGQPSAPPSVVAATTGDPQVISELNTDPEAPWRDALLERGVESVAAVPLVHDEVSYGVLTVYGTEPDSFDESERALLLDIAEILSSAIDRAELRTALTADRVVEVELQLSGSGYYLFEVARAMDNDGSESSVEVLATIPHNETGAWQFLSIPSGETERVRSELAGQSSVQTVELIETSGEAAVVRVHTNDRPPESLLGNVGGIVKASVVTPRTATIIVEFDEGKDVRGVVDAVEQAFGPVSLQRYHKQEIERDRSSVLDRCELTEKQATALRTAYRYGYFEDTRQHYAEEIAEALGVSRPTFQRHLRTAERKVFDELLDGDVSR